jgi:hypothetical protein
MRKRNFLVPVHIDTGKLMNHCYTYSRARGQETHVLVPNFEIDLQLFLKSIYPTRGSFRAIFEDNEGHEYYMMGSDFNALLNSSVQIPIFDGTFTVAHKSYDYTIRQVDPIADEPLDQAKMQEMVMENQARSHDV